MNSSRLGAASRGRRVMPRQSAVSAGQDVRKHRPDYILVLLMTILLGFGAVTVFAIGPGITSIKGLPENFYTVKQLTAIALGIIAFVVASVIKVSIWKKLAIPFIVLSSAVAVSVRFYGEEINGAYRWLQIGGFSFQAAELIKFTLIIWLAGYLVKQKREQSIAHRDTLKMIGITVGVIVLVVAGLQSDLGSAAVMMAIVGFMAYVAGLPMKKLVVVSFVVLAVTVMAVMSSQYRRDRVTTFLNPTADCQNEGYQACQALITVGSGGIFGKGLGRSVQAYGYLPEAANDSIFAIVSEKFGFVGSALIIAVFFLLFRRIKSIAETSPNDYTRLLVSGILVWLSVQMMINVGAMIGLLPLKGITLPFVSYGGTSIIFVMAAVGIVFQVSRYTDLSQRRVVKRIYGKSRATESTHLRPVRWGRG